MEKEPDMFDIYDFAASVIITRDKPSILPLSLPTQGTSWIYDYSANIIVI